MENETLDEYFLNIKQLCSRGSIENSTLIQYAINGIKILFLKCGFSDINKFKQ